MYLITTIKNIYKKVSHTGGLSFSHGVESDEAFIKSFPEPQNDLERSFFQYKCQKWQDSAKFKYLISSIVSALFIIPFKIRYRLNEKKCLFSGYNNNVMTADFSRDRVIFKEMNDGVFPVFINNDEGILTKDDLRWLSNISVIKHGFFFYFKTMCRIAIYSKAIRMYNPRKIICSAEYSFTSSLLTEYCENKGIEHVNIMHGEKIFEPRDAFSRFTRFYIWDEHYLKLFHRLRAEETYYVIEPKVPFNLDECIIGHYTYYLQSETTEQLQIIKSMMDKLSADYYVRPHPVYGSSNIYNVFDSNRIENNKKISVKDSLNRTEYAISVDSTVLYEAFLAGRKVIIDDISNPQLFNELKNRDYIMMHKDHQLLSKILKI